MQFSEFWGGSDQTSFRVNFHIVLQAKDKKDRNVHFQCGRRLHLSSSRASSLPLGVIERRRSACVRAPRQKTGCGPPHRLINDRSRIVQVGPPCSFLSKVPSSLLTSARLLISLFNLPLTARAPPLRSPVNSGRIERVERLP